MKHQSSVEFLLNWMESERLPYLPIEITSEAREIERQLWLKAYEAGEEDGKTKANQSWIDVYVQKDNLNQNQ
jgi:hypothetical protein